MRRTFPGVMHALFYYGFLVLFAATVMVFLSADLGIDAVFEGDFYLYFESLAVDVFGILFLLGVGIGVTRRYVVRPPYLVRNEPWDAILLGSLFAIALTGFLLEGIRIEATGDPWAAWSPGGNVVAHAVSPLSDGALEDMFPWLWGLHVLMWHALLASLPFTKALHWFTTPVNLFFARPVAPRGVPAPTDFDAEDVRLGIGNAADMTWKQLFDLDACTECGRCTSVCPAHASGSELDPKRVILDLRDAIRARGLEAEPLAGGVVSYEALWACTTCRACEEACPAGIEHVPTILGCARTSRWSRCACRRASRRSSRTSRRASTRSGARPPAAPTGWRASTSPSSARLRRRRASRSSTGSAAPRPSTSGRRRSPRAVVASSVTRESASRCSPRRERCNGDVARRTGNEFHYDMLARENVETLNGAGVTTLSHALSTLPPAAPSTSTERFGGRYEVRHHSELVSALIDEGRVRLRPGEHERAHLPRPLLPRPLQPAVRGAAPRCSSVLQVERGGDAAAPARESFCCGAGGGHAFFDETEGPDKVNQIRAREAAATGATTVVTGCPFCLTMLTSGARAVAAPERTLRTVDFVELVAEALDE